jgi:hypothetical protein
MDGTQEKARTEGRAKNESGTNFNPRRGQEQPQPTIILAAALAYAAAGVPVFPCRPDKRPATPNGFKDASTDPDIIRAWWTRYPQALIGRPTGAASGVVVLDLDNDATTGADGDSALADLIAAYGDLPETWEVMTPRGGRHIYFSPSLTPILIFLLCPSTYGR